MSRNALVRAARPTALARLGPLAARPTRRTSHTVLSSTSRLLSRSAAGPPNPPIPRVIDRGPMAGPVSPVTSPAGSGCGPSTKGPEKNRRLPTMVGPIGTSSSNRTSSRPSSWLPRKILKAARSPTSGASELREGRRRRKRRGRRRERERPGPETAPRRGRLPTASWTTWTPPPGWLHPGPAATTTTSTKVSSTSSTSTWSNARRPRTSRWRTTMSSRASFAPSLLASSRRRSTPSSSRRSARRSRRSTSSSARWACAGRPRPGPAAATSRPAAAARGAAAAWSSRRSRRSSAAATRSSSRSSRRASAPRGRPSRPTSASPAATSC